MPWATNVTGLDNQWQLEMKSMLTNQEKFALLTGGKRDGEVVRSNAGILMDTKSRDRSCFPWKAHESTRARVWFDEKKLG